jgi:peptide/nickel transport system permease protein
MFSYVVRRILATIPVMGVVALLVFLLMHLGPGDPAAILAGDYATPDRIQEIRQQMGLDRPIYEQFLVWLGLLLKGDLGQSIYSGYPVARIIAQRLEPTLALAATTMIFAIVIAVPLGIVAAWKAGTWIDRMVMVFAVMAFSFPVFLTGYALIYALSMKAGVLPVQGYKSLSEGIVPFFRHILLPSITLGSVYVALIARITRATMIEVLREDYIRTAHAKGLSTAQVLLGHALKNASVPIVTIIGVGIAIMIGGVVVTETVFVIPGLGRLTTESVMHRDYPVIQGVVLLFSFAYVLINLVIDILYTFLDPRVRY